MNTHNVAMFKKVSLAALTVLTLVTLAACGKSGGSARRDNDLYNNNGGAYCPGCGNGQNLGTAVGESYWMGSPQVEASLVLNLVLGTNGYGQTISVTNGRFDMNLPYAVNCGVPPGSYQVRSLQPGQFGGTTFGNMQLLATGPTQVTINIPQGGMSSIGGRLTGVAYMNYQSESCKLLVQ